MVDRKNRVKKKGFRRTPGSNTVKHYSKKKKTFAHCALTGVKLHGMGNQSRSVVRSLSASEKTPSAKFAGVLSGKARKIVAEQAALVFTGRKTDIEVPAPQRHYVKQALKVMK